MSDGRKWHIFTSIGQTWNGLITEQEVINELIPYFPEYEPEKMFDLCLLH